MRYAICEYVTAARMRYADAGLSVKDVLKAKHPVGQSASTANIPSGTPPQTHQVIFDRVDAAL